MNGYYTLKGKTPVESDKFCRLPIEQSRVGLSGDDECYVSTVFLSIDHAYDGGLPVLFETMIFGGEHDEYQERYHTWEEAEYGHKRACALAGIKV